MAQRHSSEDCWSAKSVLQTQLSGENLEME